MLRDARTMHHIGATIKGLHAEVDKRSQNKPVLMMRDAWPVMHS